ncbi:MAG: TIGR03619 family F420-dependent LLM class oxidoreductase [Acidimicrobiia bacterium]
MTVSLGVHLPQYGRAAGAEAVSRCARQAEELGLADVWVSDHLAVPAANPYPAPYLFEPIITLTWAAAATTTVGIGTSVLIGGYRRPLHLAKALATLDVLSAGRLTVGIGVGWTKEEFAGLGVPYDERGARTDEAIDALRACWEERPTNFTGASFELVDLVVLPQPTRRVPILVGGSSAAAVQRAASKGDGWHGLGSPEQLAPVAAAVRALRPEPSFVLSARTDWDGLATDADVVRRQLDDYLELGFTHVVGVPAQRDLDSWLRSVEALHAIVTSR